MNKCRVCGIELTDENWFPSLKKKNCIICKKCNNDKMQLWRESNRDQANKTARKHYHNSPRKHMDSCNRSRSKVRTDLIKEYGGKCCECGITDIDVLDIDHINNNGAEQRREGMYGYNLYRWLKKNHWPKDSFQLLCRNCNWKKELKRRRSKWFIKYLKQ